MAFEPIATHECRNGEAVTVGKNDTPGGAPYALVTTGAYGREIVIEFDRVFIERRSIAFAVETAEGRTVSTGQIEGQPTGLGEVGLWLSEWAGEPLCKCETCGEYKPEDEMRGLPSLPAGMGPAFCRECRERAEEGY